MVCVLVQSILHPTGVDIENCKSIVFLLFWTSHDVNVEVVESLGSIDHNSIEFSVITQVQLKESKESVPDFRRANFQAFRSYIAAIERREILNGKSVEDRLVNR